MVHFQRFQLFCSRSQTFIFDAFRTSANCCKANIVPLPVIVTSIGLSRGKRLCVCLFVATVQDFAFLGCFGRACFSGWRWRLLGFIHADSDGLLLDSLLWTFFLIDQPRTVRVIRSVTVRAIMGRYFLVSPLIVVSNAACREITAPHLDDHRKYYPS